METNIQKLAEEIKQNKNITHKITPRQLFNHFGRERRTPNNCQIVDEFLNNNSLIVEPHYSDVWIDEDITLKHKPIATTEIPIDPIRRINIIDSASSIPLYVNNNDTLLEAMTLMQCNDFSQLPVISGGIRSLVGYISWKSISKAMINGIETGIVKDYIETNIVTLSPDTPLIEAVEIIKKHDFAVVIAKDKSLYGIVTVNDITNQFIEETESFVILNEIESHLRNLMRDKILLEDLKKLCCKNDEKISSIDDMSFGDYIAIFGNENQWSKLEIKADRKIFIKQLTDIGSIRNEIMHFRPKGIDFEKKNQLESFVNYLRILTSCKR